MIISCLFIYHTVSSSVNPSPTPTVTLPTQSIHIMAVVSVILVLILTLSIYTVLLLSCYCRYWHKHAALQNSVASAYQTQVHEHESSSIYQSVSETEHNTFNDYVYIKSIVFPPEKIDGIHVNHHYFVLEVGETEQHVSTV